MEKINELLTFLYERREDKRVSFQKENRPGAKNYYVYFEPDNAPVLINANKIKNLSYLVVGKTFDEINTPTLGFAETDRIVIRNK